MTETITVARPYAKALFEHAKDKGVLNEWSERLAFLDITAKDKLARAYFKNASVSSSEKVKFLIGLSPSLLNEAKAFLDVLARSDRLVVLPEIAMHFEEAKANHERSIDVCVRVPFELNQEQQQKLQTALEARLQKKVALSIEIDPAVIGGMVIKAQDTVLDFSLSDKLQKLAQSLAA